MLLSLLKLEDARSLISKYFMSDRDRYSLKNSVIAVRSAFCLLLLVSCFGSLHLSEVSILHILPGSVLFDKVKADVPFLFPGSRRHSEDISSCTSRYSSNPPSQA